MNKLILATVLMLSLMGVGPCSARADVGDAIQYLVRNAPNHPMYSELGSSRMASHLLEASVRHGGDVWLLTAMTFYESSFSSKAKGKLKEIGLLQVMPMHRKTCRKQGYDLKTEEGQIFCGAYLLSRAVKHCGGARSGLSMYASGKCRPRTAHTARVVDRRFKLAKKLRDKFNE